MRSAIFSLCGWFAALVVGNDCLADVAAPVSVEWRVLENTAENNYRAELVLQNDSDAPLPARWTLYFNSSSRLLPESVSAPFALEHVNGDFFALRPTETSVELTPGESRRIEYRGSPWAINLSDAPCGFYWVAEDDASNELPPVEVSRRLGNFPDGKLLIRGAGDQLPLQTPEVRFAENEALALLPASKLPPVLPTPLRVTDRPGKVTIDSETAVVCDPALEHTAGFLVDALEPLVGRKLRVVIPGEKHANAIQLRIANRVRLSADGRAHILGMQGALWGENLRSAETLEYMAFPRMIAVSERAWAPEPAWTQIVDSAARDRELRAGWNRFANALGQRELPRLDVLRGGVAYRLAPPGAIIRDGAVHANAAFPGLAIRYTTDGSTPTAESPRYAGPIPATALIRLRTFDTNGRGSRTVTIENSDVAP